MKNEPEPVSDGGITSKGIWLFVDLLINAVGGWLFWMIIARLSTPSDIGFATTLIGMVSLAVGFASLGFDWALLREVSTRGKNAFGTLLVVKILVLIVLSPVVLYLGSHLYDGKFAEYMIYGIPIMFLYGASCILRSSVQGILKVKILPILAILGVTIKILLGTQLLIMGYDATAIILAYLVSMAVVVAGMFLPLRSLGFAFGPLSMIKDLVKLGLANYINTITSILLSSLSIILLASIVNDPTSVGIFYVSLMIVSVVSGIGGSLAIVAIPTSAIKNQDVSGTSFRLGLFISVPVIAVMITSPSLVLGILGEEYVSGSLVLILLSISVLPTILLSNCITRLNYERDLRNLIILGSIQAASFLITFFIFVGIYGIIGSAIAILTSTGIASVYSMRMMNNSLKPFVIAFGILSAGVLVGVALQDVDQLLSMFASAMVSIILILLLKMITIKEILYTLTSIIKG